MKQLLSRVFGAILFLGAGYTQAENPSGAQSSSVQSGGVVFENVRVFDGTSQRLSESVNVLVAGNVIQEISR